MDPASVTALRAELWRRGWRPLAVVNHDAQGPSPGKRPIGKDWRGAALADPPWAACHPAVDHALNTGILCDGLRAIDLDIEDRGIVDRLVTLAETVLGLAPMRYRANSPRSLLVYRAAEGAPEKESIASDAGKVEVLGAGQQFVAFGMHHSGAALEWTTSLDEISFADVPAVTREQIRDFLTYAARIIGAAPPKEPPPPRAGDNSASDFLSTARAISAIPNGPTMDSWEAWNRVGMALWAATEGSEAGRTLWHEWSKQHPTYDAANTDARWDAITSSPPSSIGAGTLFYMARQAASPPPDDHAYDDAPKAETPSPRPPGSPLGRAFDAARLATLEPYQWLYGRFLCAGYMSLLGAPSGVGKTAYLVHAAVSLALGRDILGEVVGPRVRVWLINGEDDTAHLDKLVWACCLYHQIDPAELEGWLWLTGAEDEHILVATQIEGRLIRTPVYERVQDFVAANEIKALSVDPFVDTHGLEENNNEQMNHAARVWYDLAREFRLGVFVAHHFRKGGVSGDQDAFRGAAALIGKSRIARTLGVMSAEDASKLGVSEDERRYFLRLDNAKSNLSAPATSAHWLRLESVDLPNGDNIQALKRWEPPGVMDGLTWPQISAILAAIERGLGDGEYYTLARSGASATRWAGLAFVGIADRQPGQIVSILAAWEKSGLLQTGQYHSPSQSKSRGCVRVNQEKLSEMRREYERAPSDDF
jgi:hypothetical protein